MSREPVHLMAGGQGRRPRRVAVFCGSKSPHDDRFGEAASALGRRVAERGATLVYGGAGVGMMKQVADAALDAGGSVIGVIPDELAEREVAYERITELHVVDSLAERKVLLTELADGFVVLPGGLGTLDELFDVVVRAQVGLHTGPVVLLDVDGYWDSLLAFLDRGVSVGLIRESNRRLLTVVASVDEALDAVLAGEES